jgi:hypothetical protein
MRPGIPERVESLKNPELSVISEKPPKYWANPALFPCDQAGKTVLAGLMKTFPLTIVAVATALSLATANAMPDLGRETGKFIRDDAPAPKDVRTFEPAKEKDATRSASFALPFRPRTVAFALPFRPRTVAFALPFRPRTVAFALPFRPRTIA